MNPLCIVRALRTPPLMPQVIVSDVYQQACRSNTSRISSATPTPQVSELLCRKEPRPVLTLRIKSQIRIAVTAILAGLSSHPIILL